MKKLFAKVLVAAGSCAFFTVMLPILMTTAQRNLFFAGWAIAFCFFGLCLYLVMTSKFFGPKPETPQQEPQQEELLPTE